MLHVARLIAGLWFWSVVEHPSYNEYTIFINIFFGGKSGWMLVFYEEVRKANWVQLADTVIGI